MGGARLGGGLGQDGALGLRVGLARDGVDGGSVRVRRALEELSLRSWSQEAQGAREVLAQALTDANALRLPMIVDW